MAQQKKSYISVTLYFPAPPAGLLLNQISSDLQAIANLSRIQVY